FGGRLHHVLDQSVDRTDGQFPRTGGVAHMAALADAAVLADHPAKALEFARQLVVQFDDFVESIGNFGIEPVIAVLQADRKIAFSEGSEGGENLTTVKLIPWNFDVHEILPQIS